MRNDQIFVLMLVVLLPLSGCFDGGGIGDADAQNSTNYDDIQVLYVPTNTVDTITTRAGEFVEILDAWADYNGEKKEMNAEGLLATCIQHEIDHLNGVLFIDHISRLKRDMILRRIMKEMRQSTSRK